MFLLYLHLLLFNINPIHIGQTYYVLKQLQPDLKVCQAIELATSIESLCKKYNLPEDEFLSILFQESSLKTDPKSCLKRPQNCTHDFGIGQVNYIIWGKKINLEPIKALKNISYSVEISAKIINHYKKKYSQKDKDWIYRYHSKTPSLKKAYKERIEAIHAKIKKYKRGYLDGRRTKNKVIGTHFNYCQKQEEISSRLP